MTELRPCPFCGSKQLDVFDKDKRDSYGDYLETVYQVECWNCDTAGPEGPSEEEATDLWNKRNPTLVPC